MAIVGTVLALSVAILLLSGLALYVAFRLRETLRDEKGESTKAVKVAFLIGLLFLSGGVFYFFASGFNVAGGGSTSRGTYVTSSASTTTGSTATSAVSTSTMASPSTTASTLQDVNMSAPSCPSRVTAGSTFTCYITVYDQGTATYSGATLVSSGDFAKFTILGCNKSVNGGPSTLVSSTSNSVSVGDIAPGTTLLALSVRAPAQSGQDSASVFTLNAPGLVEPISVTFTIQVTA